MSRDVGESALFSLWIQRIKKGMPSLQLTTLAQDEFDAQPRMKLIHEIHSDMVDRYPLGTSERLSEIIMDLHIGDDEDAIKTLSELIEMETLGGLMNS